MLRVFESIKAVIKRRIQFTMKYDKVDRKTYMDRNSKNEM